MDNILPLGSTPEESAQMQAELNVMVAELRRMRVEMDFTQREIEASQNRTDLMLKEVEAMLANRRRK